MSEQGEQGKTGERGKHGDRGESGVTGDRGVTGQHGERGASGQRGVAGERGEKGDHGQPGETGPAYSSWLTRRVVLAYTILVVGIVLSFLVSFYLFDDAIDHIDAQTKAQCEAGNQRSELQVRVFQEGKARTEAFDFRSIINAPEPERTELAAKTKRESLEAADRNAASVPFLDCDTGKRITTTTIGG